MSVLRTTGPRSSTSDKGQSLPKWADRATSALPPGADFVSSIHHFRFVPFPEHYRFQVRLSEVTTCGLTLDRQAVHYRICSRIDAGRGLTVWTSVTNTRPRSNLSRWSVAVAVSGALCNLLFLILTFYQEPIRPNEWRMEWRMLILFTAITLAPSLVLLAFRRYFAVAFIYASMLFCILVWRIEYPHQYYVGQKYDNPGVTLLFLGLISAVVFSVWATIRFAIFMWRVLKPNRAELETDRPAGPG
jgi:hypothetical protein